MSALICVVERRGWARCSTGMYWREISKLTGNTRAHAEGINKLQEGPRNANLVDWWRQCLPVGTCWAHRRGAPSTPCPFADVGTPGSSSRPQLVMLVPSAAMHWAT